MCHSKQEPAGVAGLFPTVSLLLRREQLYSEFGECQQAPTSPTERRPYPPPRQHQPPLQACRQRRFPGPPGPSGRPGPCAFTALREVRGGCSADAGSVHSGHSDSAVSFLRLGLSFLSVSFLCLLVIGNSIWRCGSQHIKGKQRRSDVLRGVFWSCSELVKKIGGTEQLGTHLPALIG